MRVAAKRSGLGSVGAALLLALVGCGPKAKPPLAPTGSPSTEIEAVHPAARSTGVFYDTEIWVRFTEPIDPASVNERTIFLKLDTVRIPVALTYDAPTRTLRLTPLAQLALLRTYTVEITSGVKASGGHPLSPTFWQFRTNGLRRLNHPTPAEGTLGESPFALLTWGAAEPPSAGSIVYRVYEAADSAVVAARSSDPISIGQLPYLMTRSPWGLGARVFWAGTAVNQTSDEHLDGPVWSFETLPAGTPVDSLFVSCTEWGYYDLVAKMKHCFGDFLFLGPRYVDGVHWPLPALKLAGARVTVETAGSNPISGRPTLWPVKEPWLSCTYAVVTPTPENASVADGVRLPGAGSQYALFESNPLTACLEAGGRYGTFYGFSLRGYVNLGYLTPNYRGHGPLLTLYYYRTSPGPAAPGS